MAVFSGRDYTVTDANTNRREFFPHSREMPQEFGAKFLSFDHLGDGRGLKRRRKDP
jgi:hypothetical protein